MAISPSEASYALLEIFILLTIAHLFGSLTRRLGLPRVVGELLAGMVVGVYALGHVVNQLVGVPLFAISDYVLLFANFSVILLVFAAGLEGGLASLRSGGAYVLGAAVAGDLVPFGLTTLIFHEFYPLSTALLLGVAAGATSTAVVSSFLQSETIGPSPAGRFLISVAAVDDVVALILLSVVLTVRGGNVDILTISGGIALSVAAWVVLLVAATLVIPRIFRIRAVQNTVHAPLVALFVLVAIVGAFGFSALIGAFIAGLAIAESVAVDKTRRTVELLVAIFGALFFAVLGAQFDVGLLLDPRLLALAALLAGIAALGKFVGVFGFARGRFRSTRVGAAIATGMIPRGEIGLVVGAIGVALGDFDQTLLGAVLLMAILTTVLGALLFREVSEELTPTEAVERAASPP